MTIDQLRLAFRRAFSSYGVIPERDLFDELVSIADHHAAEESAAAVSDRAS